MQYIDCKKYAQEILDEVKALPTKGKLVIITVGDDKASQSYVKGKIKDCKYCGIPVEHIKIENDKNVSETLQNAIFHANYDPHAAGIILQLPLPEPLNEDTDYYTNLIASHKDVDGLAKNTFYEPCTPKGIVHLMKQELGDLTGLDVLIIGRSDLVGKPLARMLLDEDCTVTVAHSKTNDLYPHMSRADVVVSAVGKPKVFNMEDCWNAELIIDVGINRDENGKLCGDFYGFSDLDYLSAKVTPVPGGVGLLTRAMLMKNVGEASQLWIDNEGWS